MTNARILQWLTVKNGKDFYSVILQIFYFPPLISSINRLPAATSSFFSFLKWKLNIAQWIINHQLSGWAGNMFLFHQICIGSLEVCPYHHSVILTIWKLSQNGIIHNSKLKLDKVSWFYMLKNWSIFQLSGNFSFIWRENLTGEKMSHSWYLLSLW